MRPESAGGGEAAAVRDAGTATGLAHVATVSFLASRAAPSLQFFFALGGGIALARAAAQRGARNGYGAALASMLQSVAVMGPARINAPLTQAITAPMMGRLWDRGARPLSEFLACLALRLVHYSVLLAVFIFVILGGLDEFTGSYETLTGWLGIVPGGHVGAGGDGGGPGPVGDLLQRDPGRRLPARARRLAAHRNARPRSRSRAWLRSSATRPASTRARS